MARNARKSGNAIEMLKADHRKVKALFEEYEAHQEPADRQRIAERAFQELEIHTQLEESTFYPAVEAKGDEDEKDLVAEALEEHAAVKELIAELRELDPSDEQYDEKFRWRYSLKTRAQSSIASS